MSEWQLYGTERRNVFESGLQPEELAYTLSRYQKKFGKNFGIQELLELEKIRAMAMIAEAINDAPEFLLDQIGKARCDSTFPSIPNSLESIALAISEST